MRVGIPTETNNNEFRVVATPAGIKELTRRVDVNFRADERDGALMYSNSLRTAGAQPASRMRRWPMACRPTKARYSAMRWTPISGCRSPIR